MDTAWIALIGTLFGGVVLKIVENFFSRGSKKIDTATAMREELRKESTSLKEELRQVEKELDEWKMKYYTVFQQYIELKTSMGHPMSEPKEEPDW